MALTITYLAGNNKPMGQIGALAVTSVVGVALAAIGHFVLFETTAGMSLVMTGVTLVGMDVITGISIAIINKQTAKPVREPVKEPVDGAEREPGAKPIDEALKKACENLQQTLRLKAQREAELLQAQKEPVIEDEEKYDGQDHQGRGDSPFSISDSRDAWLSQIHSNDSGRQQSPLSQMEVYVGDDGFFGEDCFPGSIPVESEIEPSYSRSRASSSRSLSTSFEKNKLFFAQPEPAVVVARARAGAGARQKKQGVAIRVGTEAALTVKIGVIEKTIGDLIQEQTQRTQLLTKASRAKAWAKQYNSEIDKKRVAKKAAKKALSKTENALKEQQNALKFLNKELRKVELVKYPAKIKSAQKLQALPESVLRKYYTHPAGVPVVKIPERSKEYKKQPPLSDTDLKTYNAGWKAGLSEENRSERFSLSDQNLELWDAGWHAARASRIVLPRKRA